MSTPTPLPPDQHRWFVACPQFVEPLLAEELTVLGAVTVKIGHAGVLAQGDLAFAYRVLLWSRLVSRLTLQLAQGYGKDQAELAVLLQGIDWSRHIRPDGSFRVRFSGQNDDIRNTRFGAQWVKDQIVDQFRSHDAQRPDSSAHPDVMVSVNLYSGKASVGVELNAGSLHTRGYRDPEQHYALHENLAAALLIRAGWPALLQAQAAAESRTVLTLLALQCGADGFLIEAALMAYDMAPGLLRGAAATVASRWPGHDAGLWASLMQEARQRRDAGLLQADRFRFLGTDTDAQGQAQARSDWETLGLPGAAWGTMPTEGEQGLVVTRLAFAREERAAMVRPRYAAIGQTLATLPPGFRGALFAPAEAPLAMTDLFYSRSYRFMNGRQESQLWTLDNLTQKVRPTVWVSEDFANRLRRNLRRLKPFLKRGETNAYRIYDADIPEFALAVDRYGDWLHVQEYAPPASIDARTARQRLEQALLTLPAVLDVDPQHIVLKQRRRQRGSEQYRKQGEAQALTVFEHGVKFRVNLTEYLDTGLFLDHRPMRYWVQQHSRERTVLNLFCYTGAVSVHAAIGGAKRVDSVDMSQTYLNWAQENFRLNGIKPSPYAWRFIRANAVEWLAGCQGRYQLIFLDPPTFSNSRRMQDSFDVQRDHAGLIEAAMRLLEPDGVLVFSNNFRRFRLDPAMVAQYAVQDYHKPSIPADFSRDPNIHQCWLIRHRGA
ncbi:MAG: bifunctional 23S rRNA (guanine(2069)-N(7))-methyltransferase RlmK/23S rRNA (guanine(2445)-N(2))-methyltransferase RlmL [Thiothrix sp.]|nr:bifunctional 23S rRNA (guanine(2069)-N(7))-methyltransferase RlmK/23S rRNA (guanine(2445)-N(2))-methyltransferase RlmL [Thiothrix sp.]HPE59513.1 bifunctional 23S rRNA (guanine(2069)-N(7))-methyltransferase RlmK/23S rRNA (guanine(2445)-N(2))-methyltransferase RlmL [Thiolinea sp.]